MRFSYERLCSQYSYVELARSWSGIILHFGFQDVTQAAEIVEKQDSLVFLYSITLIEACSPNCQKRIQNTCKTITIITGPSIGKSRVSHLFPTVTFSCRKLHCRLCCTLSVWSTFSIKQRRVSVPRPILAHTREPALKALGARIRGGSPVRHDSIVELLAGEVEMDRTSHCQRHAFSHSTSPFHIETETMSA
jgi:hypothetical protein